MFKLMKADFYRVFHKKFFYIYTIFCTAAFGLIVLGMNPSTISNEEYVTFANIIIMLSTLVIGIFLYSILYGDDLKYKNSQSILGFGYNRKDVIIRKFIIFTLLVILAFAYLYLIINIYAFLFNFKIDAQMHKMMLNNIFKKILMILSYASITNMMAFSTQNATASIVVFVLLVTGTISTILNLILTAGPVVRLIGDLSPYLVSTLVETMGASLLTKGTIIGNELLFMLLYLVITTIAAMQLFEHKELEF